VLAIVIGRSLVSDIRLVEARRKTQATYRSLENFLFEQEGVRRPSQVFTSDFNLYFPDRFPHAPFRNGGWMRFELNGYESVYPTLCTSSIECLYEDCRRRGITHLVLAATAGQLGAGTAQVYDGAAPARQFLAIREQGGFRVYRVGGESGGTLAQSLSSDCMLLQSGCADVTRSRRPR
jgi:hypothetical protein